MNRIAVACWLSVVVAWAPPERVRASREDSAKTFRIVPGLSQASYAVDEVFLNENNRLFTAVGVTTAVSGTIVVDSSRLADSRIDEIVVDLRELKSDSDRRDRALREKYLDTGRFPSLDSHAGSSPDFRRRAPRDDRSPIPSRAT